MDSFADPHTFDDKKPEAASEGAADSKGETSSQALTPFEAKALAGSERKEPEPPKIEPIPGSALVVLPPPKETFGDSFAAGERIGGPAGAKRPSWASYGLRAAAVLLVAGGAYALGSHYLSIPGLATPSQPPAGTHVAALASPPSSSPVAQASSPALAPGAVAPDSDLAALRHDAKLLSDEVHKLQTRLVALQSQTPEEIRSLKKSLDGLKADLEAEKADSKAQIAQLSAKLDHLHESSIHVSAAERAHTPRLDAKAIQATLDRAARNEAADGDATGSVPASAASPRAQPVNVASAETPHHGPQLLNDWIVRDVYRGIALVEGPQGAIEVVPGDVLPGAGVVRAIVRRGDGWIVLTSRGYVDYDHD
jgi:hypothetical protein